MHLPHKPEHSQTSMAGKRRAENGDQGKNEPSKSKKEDKHPDSTGATASSADHWTAMQVPGMHACVTTLLSRHLPGLGQRLHLIELCTSGWCCKRLVL